MVRQDFPSLFVIVDFYVHNDLCTDLIAITASWYCRVKIRRLTSCAYLLRPRVNIVFVPCFVYW